MSYSHAPAAPTSCCCNLFGLRSQSGHLTRSCGETYVDDDHLSGSSEYEAMFGEKGFVKREA
jgi:hypothetical protein